MILEDELTQVPTPEICRRCREQVQRYRRSEPIDDRFCDELFRRAVVTHDEAAWHDLYVIYRELVEGWCRGYRAASLDIDGLVGMAWEKFWHNYSPAKLARAGSTADVLQYLKACVHSVVVDATRPRGGQANTFLSELPEDHPDHGPNPDDAYATSERRRLLWDAVEGHLTSPRERLLVYLLYQAGLKPGEICACYPDTFPVVQDVYRMTRNILERLKRSAMLRAWRDQFPD